MPSSAGGGCAAYGFGSSHSGFTPYAYAAAQHNGALPRQLTSHLKLDAWFSTCPSILNFEHKDVLPAWGQASNDLAHAGPLRIYYQAQLVPVYPLQEFFT